LIKKSDNFRHFSLDIDEEKDNSSAIITLKSTTLARKKIEEKRRWEVSPDLFISLESRLNTSDAIVAREISYNTLRVIGVDADYSQILNPFKKCFRFKNYTV
jgi:hypothetical protein